MTYNSWPLGKLPKSWQRPEPDQVKSLGYIWQDPREIINIFESKLAKFSGSKYAVLTDCCSNALFLSLQFRMKFCGLKIGTEVEIPSQTYVSVPMQLIHAGLQPKFKKKFWSGIYELLGTGIYDSAARFTNMMYQGQDSLQVLSFQIKKRLPIGKGGAILTNSLDAYNWLKLASYDGRDLSTDYNTAEHIKTLGWHYYMTPEDAARGIILMDQLPLHNEDTMTSEHYPELDKLPIFRDFSSEGSDV